MFLALSPSLLLLFVLTALSALIFSLMDMTQPAPYMDEIFHVPQAKHYCNGNFKVWDDKITTLPGLYLFSVGVLNPFAQAWNAFSSGGNSSSSEAAPLAKLCTTSTLRAVNVVLSALTFVIGHWIVVQIHGGKHYFDPKKAALSAFNVSIFPLLFFYSFFYYTDVGSTFMVLLMYCLHLDGRDWAASFIGFLSVVFRQTNIVWVAFVAAQSVYPILNHSIHERMIQGGEKPVKFSLTTSGQMWELMSGTLTLLKEPLRMLVLIKNIVLTSGGYIIVWFLFVAFLVVNEGIVVGDRTAHQVNFHPTQILYFCAFTLALTAPYQVTKLSRFLGFVRKNLLLSAVCLAGMALTVHYFTLAHPYLLADNRHYTFYIWRRLINFRPFVKYLLVPVYFFGGYCVLHSIRRTSVIFQLTFPLCVAVNLAPQLLLEFRYFVVPFLFYRMQVRPVSWPKLVLETAVYAAVNAAAIAIYVMRPFRWEHEPDDVQRFMW